MSDPLMSLELNMSSWKQIFETLHLEGLADMSRIRERIYLESTGEHYSRGNFWGAIQSLEEQVARKEKSL